jgi:hypothetical protein
VTSSEVYAPGVSHVSILSATNKQTATAEVVVAQKVVVEVVDDLDGVSTEGVETVDFSLDGVNYTIDLCAENADQLRDTLAGFVEHARRIGGRIKRGMGTRAAANSRDTEPVTAHVRVHASTSGHANKAIREWARKAGHLVADRGRIPAEIVAEYDAAHQVPARRGVRPVGPEHTG